MIYQVRTTKKFDKSFKKLDRQSQKLIKNWIEGNLMDCPDPRFSGKPLTGNFKGVWRYRIGSYRLLTKIDDDKLIIFAIDVGHRRNIYN
ncbi:MAG: type II toxin-antitoxin system RelE/ParE family toxin [Peptoniphilus harei]|uniref:type II toxin-antitoxin system RelE family toxin n=1 Tax=Peptoniphilus harei TaxID=54005 RepID=UPI0028FFC4B0|nr:type II toxin-antitoxin system RelE/ParE family toxin [Peptoniphilus harei]MDU2373340.1 type II toxin-antitoxin system RelE/ParE family toxin [Peptoniphilus harei]MDU5470883.1 type II toxin-antitoxin system RelE/ParE family toxin [Peptoniphilus harei]MDU6098798.1 type II toxin-antitoxin system RelE/ParE family toxin [Peptoniphilus harei]